MYRNYYWIVEGYINNTYLMLLCSQRHFDQMRHMSLPTRCYPFNPAIVNPANTSYSTSCSRTHIQPFAVSLSQPVQPPVPVYKVTPFSCFRSPSRTQQALLCSLQHLRPLASTCLTLLLVSICSILVLSSQLTYLVQPHLARCHALVFHTVLSRVRFD